MWPIIENALEHNDLVTAFAVVGAYHVVVGCTIIEIPHLRAGCTARPSPLSSAWCWPGGTVTGGQKGLADMALFSGIGLMGRAMLRDFAIVATAFEVQATGDLPICIAKTQYSLSR